MQHNHRKEYRCSCIQPCLSTFAVDQFLLSTRQSQAHQNCAPTSCHEPRTTTTYKINSPFGHWNNARRGLGNSDHVLSTFPILQDRILRSLYEKRQLSRGHYTRAHRPKTKKTDWRYHGTTVLKINEAVRTTKDINNIMFWLRLYCVLKLCTVISILRWAVLTVLWIGFCRIV